MLPGGRDHKPQGFTVSVAGGGVRRGLAYGATDEYGYRPARDDAALLGLDHERLTHRYAGCDFRLTDVHGRLVSELLV